MLEIDEALNDELTTAQAGAYLGVTPGRIRQLVGDGRLPAKRKGTSGRDLVIRRQDLTKIVFRRPFGRGLDTR